MTLTENRDKTTESAVVVRLRPHHLLCTQGYAGKGYDARFVANMTAVTAKLRGKGETAVEIVFSADDLCEFCPKMNENGVCADNAKVSLFDHRVKEMFELENKRYAYHELIGRIDAAMTAEKMKAICGTCEWFKNSDCLKNVTGGRYVKTKEK